MKQNNKGLADAGLRRNEPFVQVALLYDPVSVRYDPCRQPATKIAGEVFGPLSVPRGETGPWLVRCDGPDQRSVPDARLRVPAQSNGAIILVQSCESVH
jgi:hypothetical protein